MDCALSSTLCHLLDVFNILMLSLETNFGSFRGSIREMVIAEETERIPAVMLIAGIPGL